MSFEILEKTPEVTPLLVRLYDTHNVYAKTGKRVNADSCAELTGIMADLLQIPLNEKESELIADVLMALMKQAEADLRVALSERLATMENVPLRIVLGLANDEIRVAEHILRKSPILHDLDLIYIMNAQGVGHGRAIAQRRGIGSAVIDALANTKDFEVAVNLSGNDGISLTNHAYGIFTAMAVDRPELGRKMISRADLPHDIAAKMMSFIGEELKAVLHERFGSEAAPVLENISQVTAELQESEALPERMERLMAFARQQKDAGDLKVSAIVQSLRRNQRASFMAQLCVYAGLTPVRVKAIVTNQGGYEFSMLCRALNVSKADFISLYLLTERFRGQQRKMFGHAELSRIMAMYDDIDADAAQELLHSSRTAQ